MKKISYIITTVLLFSSLCACKKDYLDVKYVEANIPIDKLYTNYTYVQQVVYNAYSYLPDGFATLDLEATTDNAESTSVTSRTQLFNTGNWNQYTNPADVYNSNFNGIRQANEYLANKGRVDISYIRDKITTTDSTTYFNARDNVKFMEGEVLFLKAFFYFELVKRYGGVPIFEKPLDFNDESTWKNIPRNSVDECMKYIVSLCDKALTIIPADLTPYSWYDAGRVTQGAIKSLKARTILYGASPLFQDNGSTYTWAQAAKASFDVIQPNTYKLSTNYASLFGTSNTTSIEAIFYRRYGSTNSLEYNNFPIVFEKSNGNSVTPSQNYVDDFEVLVKNASNVVIGSVPFDWNNPVHAATPYANRDPRLAFSVVVNGATFGSTSIQTFPGGNSALPKQNATRTGYYLLKWINPALDLVNATTSNHAWMYFRYGETLLNYAEAMYNAYGATGDPQGYGLTALQAINLVRQRTGVALPAITATQLNQQRIEHERNTELGFEGFRMWDVRRWKKGSTYFKAPLNQVVITGTTAPFTYSYRKLEDRVWDEKMNLFPIPQSEITKTGWAQNLGW